MYIKVIREISEVLESAYSKFLDAYTVMQAEQEEGWGNPDMDSKFDQVNRAFGELREHLNQSELQAKGVTP